MKATIKSNMANTYHRDGTVSYWSVLRQQWVRTCAGNIRAEELATMNDWERRRIAQHAA